MSEQLQTILVPFTTYFMYASLLVFLAAIILGIVQSKFVRSRFHKEPKQTTPAPPQTPINQTVVTAPSEKQNANK